MDLLQPILPSEIYRVALSLLDLDNPFNPSLCPSHSLSILCISRPLLRDASLVVFRLTDIVFRLTAVVFALLEVVRVVLCTTVAPGTRRNQGWHLVTIEKDIAKLMRSSFYLLEVAFTNLNSKPQSDEEAGRFLEVLGRYQGLTEKSSGQAYESLIKHFKINALQQIRQECEILYGEAADLAGPEGTAALRVKSSPQAEGAQPMQQDVGVLDRLDEVESDLWHDYPEEASDFEFLEGEQDDLQNLWPDKLVEVGGDSEDEEGGNYDPEEEQTVSDGEEGVDTCDYEDDPERYFPDAGIVGTDRNSCISHKADSVA